MSHISHLFALYPSDEITLRGTPELAKAARVSLERREQNGGGRGGWSSAWYANLWARLEEGDHAYSHIRGLLSTATETLLNGSARFQIDADFGACSGIAEMLLQSHSGVIAILPALPAAWPDGHYKGLRARGDVEVDAAWKGGRAISAALRPDRPATSSSGRRKASALRGFSPAGRRSRRRKPAASGRSTLNRARNIRSHSNEYAGLRNTIKWPDQLRALRTLCLPQVSCPKEYPSSRSYSLHPRRVLMDHASSETRSIRKVSEVQFGSEPILTIKPMNIG